MYLNLLNLLCILLCFTRTIAEEQTYTPAIGLKGTKCYDSFNRPQRCIPEFENAAFNLIIEATNTCGEEEPTEFCVQTGISSRKSCDVCYYNQHGSQYLTDFHSGDNQTWWQSDTMLEGIQYPSQVNLTLNLGKAFDITYVRIWFYSPRPESFSIYKRTSEDGPWIPYQFYSGTCRDTYGQPDTLHTSRGEETRALCTSEYSDISPLKNGNVAFSTLEGRPSAYFFDSSPELQEWVTATDVRITLDRLNTFGDEAFRDPSVLKSYFYAISDIAVGARCKCNGHASECTTSTAIDGSTRRVCKCEHNTAGPDCNECLPFYNDAPWGRASESNVHECKACNCNNFSNRCFFDEELYKRTGHGGHCLDCTANRDGPNCERCRENYFQREDNYCVACNCDPVGSRNLQCNSEGKCQCKPGVTGDKCDRCDVNYYDFGTHGCKSCGCSDAGSFNNQASCDPYSGTCHCKENVEGKRCRECKPGFFNLDRENEFGCTPCFCYGHSSECVSATGYSKYQLESSFAKNSERWRAEDEYNNNVKLQYNAFSQSLGVSSPGSQAVYFLAPDRYLGDQRASYNQILKFTLRIGENRPVPTATDIILEGAGGYVTNTIFAQRNPMPTIQNQEYTFRLHEHPNYGWQPKQSARAFISILTNLTAIRIRATYTTDGVGFLDDVRLETASRVAGRSALWVEQCNCPEGYVGQFCESCAPRYRHSPSLGGPFMPCIPCDCNDHADICDSETGRCICEHNTAGDNCELCARGYYGNALIGTQSDCKPCGCPEGGACIQLDEDLIMCVECPLGYTGHRCDSCADGFFGDPMGRIGRPTACQACECNLNIDTNAIGNCNTTTGECLKCIHNTGGPKCDQCLPGYYGDALALPKGDCERCECYVQGTEEALDGTAICDQITGTCRCKPHVQGRNCDKCEEGYYNIISGEGCHTCNCNPVGSVNHTCDLYTGQCVCKPGITGLRCDQCEPYKYGFSTEGCKTCDCDHIGSKALQCDAFGQCPCLDNVEGRRCDRCKENKYDRQRGCVDCPDCYNLVQDAARRHLIKLENLREILDEIERNPTVVDNEEFELKLNTLQNEIDEYYDYAKNSTGGDKSIYQKLDEINERQKKISRTLSEIEENIHLAKEKGNMAQQNVTYSENTLKSAEEELNNALYLIDTEGKAALQKAKEKALEFGQQSQKMTQIAQEARNTADNLNSDADYIVIVSKEAKNKSTEAYEIAKNATDLQKNLSEEIRLLNNDVSNIEQKLQRIKDESEATNKKATDSKDKALALFNEVNKLNIPDVNITTLKHLADSTRKEAKRLINDTQDLIGKNNELVNDIKEQILTAQDLLLRGEDYQNEANELLREIEAAKLQAQNAVKLGDETLSKATATYETLKHFDRQVRESKDRAEEALRRIPEIRRIIESTVTQTENTQGALLAAKHSANNSLQTAEAADNLAKEASMRVEQINKDTQVLLKNATGLNKEAKFMAERVENTEIEFRELLKETDNNGSLIAKAKEKVGRAGKDSEEASKKVNDILSDVEGIMKELDNLPNLDESVLENLEQELKQAEKKFQEANLDSILQQLLREQKERNALVDFYNDEIKRLTKEVENVEQIANALPDGCFKRVDLEP